MPIRRINPELEGDVRANEPLAPKTTVRVGGPAELYVRPATVSSLQNLLAQVREDGMPLTVLGGGANTLVGDGGVFGVVLRLPPDLFPEEVELSSSDGGRITLGAGAPVSRLIQLMKAHRLTGAEFLCGVPGTIGGACAMNAGNKTGECMSLVEAVEMATSTGVGWLSKGELSVGYRETAVPAGGVVTRVRFRLAAGDALASRARMEEDLAYRKKTQPLSLPSFGSVFRNPPGDFAGRLIERVGLKGRKLGGAQISTLHANWIVNLGGATAGDIVSLMELAQERVKEETGVALTPEVKRVGTFS